MVINPIVGVYIPIIRIPIKGGMSLSQKNRDFWPWHTWNQHETIPMVRGGSFRFSIINSFLPSKFQGATLGILDSPGAIRGIHLRLDYWQHLLPWVSWLVWCKWMQQDRKVIKQCQMNDLFYWWGHISETLTVYNQRCKSDASIILYTFTKIQFASYKYTQSLNPFELRFTVDIRGFSVPVLTGMMAWTGLVVGAETGRGMRGFVSHQVWRIFAFEVDADYNYFDADPFICFSSTHSFAI